MGLFDGLNGMLGMNNNFQAQNPYAPNALSDALAKSNQVYQQQETLAQALQARAAGQGPNPALEQLHQTTDQNAQAAAGLLASQRGLNPALAARMAAQAQTTANQTAGGQAATLAAGQQISGQDQLAGLYGTMGNQTLGQQGTVATANLGAQKINADVAGQNATAAQKTGGGILNGIGAVGAMFGLADGGTVPGRANVPGDSPTNDTVSAKLSPGEIVIPRSHADNAKDAKDFIDALMSKKKANAVPGGFGKVLEAHRALTQALQAVK